MRKPAREEVDALKPDAAVPAEVRSELLGLLDELGGLADERPGDPHSRITVVEAVETGLEGNAAVGALLADPDGAVMLQERNRMFAPRFRSDFHAEMVLLTRYEEKRGNRSDLRGHTLVTSLEPCEMCTIRIINSGVTNTVYVASDPGKGGITGPNRLAGHWARLAEPLNFAAADCSPRLAEISLEAFQATIEGVSQKLLARRLPDRA